MYKRREYALLTMLFTAGKIRDVKILKFYFSLKLLGHYMARQSLNIDAVF